jgi:GT2 family glycosyltransferase
VIGHIVAVVLNWNGEHDTAACLDSLLAQRDVALEILIVDNDSADGSGARLHARYPALPYLQTGANLGYAGGNNRGIEWTLARGADAVLVINNDTVADASCVRRLVEALDAEPRVAGVAPLIRRYDDPSRIWFAGGKLSTMRAIGSHENFGASVAQLLGTLPDPSRLQPCTFLSGCCILFRAEALRDVGTFREDFFAYVEDVELSYRLARGGWRLGWMPTAQLAHRVPQEGSPESPMQIRLRDRNRRRMARSLYGWRDRLAFALWFWPTRLIHLVRYRLRGDRERAAALLAGLRER